MVKRLLLCVPFGHGVSRVSRVTASSSGDGGRAAARGGWTNKPGEFRRKVQWADVGSVQAGVVSCEPACSRHSTQKASGDGPHPINVLVVFVQRTNANKWRDTNAIITSHL